MGGSRILCTCCRIYTRNLDQRALCYKALPVQSKPSCLSSNSGNCVWSPKLSFQLQILFLNVDWRGLHGLLQNGTKNFPQALGAVSFAKSGEFIYVMIYVLSVVSTRNRTCPENTKQFSRSGHRTEPLCSPALLAAAVPLGHPELLPQLFLSHTPSLGRLEILGWSILSGPVRTSQLTQTSLSWGSISMPAPPSAPENEFLAAGISFVLCPRD